MIKLPDLSYLEGRRFCAVLVQAGDAERSASKARLQCLRGRACIENGYLSVIGSHGTFRVPPSAYHTIMENDGTPLLKDAEYYCFVRVDDRLSYN